jgi:mRNA-degrading endonuclease toxin of MazEF toxin-antitoxin module
MPSKRNMKAGEIWIVELSSKSSNIIGHELAKTRPCMVVVNNLFAKLATIIPLSSSKNTLKLPHTILIKRNSKNQLNNDSVAVIFQLRSLSYDRFHKQIGVMEKSDLEKVKLLIKDYFNF